MAPPVENLSPSREKRVEQFHALTGLRGVAAWWIVFYHFEPLFTSLVPQFSFFHPITAQGFRAVPLFFLLSGFVITHNYWNKLAHFSRLEYGHYLWHRFARVYPAYLVALLIAVLMLGVSILLGIPFNRDAYPLKTLGLELFMLHKWGSLVNNGWNYPSWSVSGEWFAYLFAFPLALWIGKKARNRTVLIILLAVVLMLELWRSLQPPPFPAFGYAPLMTTFLFLAGSLAWRLRAPILAWKAAPFLDLGAALIVVIVSISFSKLPVAMAESIALIALTVLVLALSFPSGVLGKVLRLPVMLWLGEISYSVYLTHGLAHRGTKPFIDRISLSGQPAWLGASLLLLHLVIILAASAALHYLVERPARNWMRNFYPRKTQKALLAPAAVNERAPQHLTL